MYFYFNIYFSVCCHHGSSLWCLSCLFQRVAHRPPLCHWRHRTWWTQWQTFINAPEQYEGLWTSEVLPLATPLVEKHYKTQIFKDPGVLEASFSKRDTTSSPALRSASSSWWNMICSTTYMWSVSKSKHRSCVLFLLCHHMYHTGCCR